MSVREVVLGAASEPKRRGIVLQANMLIIKGIGAQMLRYCFRWVVMFLDENAWVKRKMCKFEVRIGAGDWALRLVL